VSDQEPSPEQQRDGVDNPLVDRIEGNDDPGTAAMPGGVVRGESGLGGGPLGGGDLGGGADLGGQGGVRGEQVAGGTPPDEE
jgi:hypothetical protein